MFLRLTVDILMIFSVLLAIANRLTENQMHELIGISMFLLIIAHNVLNRRWYTAIFRGKYTIRRILNFTVNLLLLAAIAALSGSSVMISRTLFSFLGIESTLLLQQIHTTAAYWFFILMAVHLGVHWARFAATVKKMAPILTIGRMPSVCIWIFLIMIVASGVNASFERDIYSKLFRFYAFDFWDFNQSLVGFFMKNLSIMGLYVIITHNALKILHGHQQTPSPYSLFSRKTESLSKRYDTD